MSAEHTREIKAALVDPRSVCERLGVLGARGSWQRQAAGVIVRCFVHEEKTPSCSVQARSGVLLWRCHGCGASGDVLSMIAAVRGLSAKRDFRELLRVSAEMAGLWHVVAELESGKVDETRARPAPAPTPVQEPERDYPLERDVAELWGASAPVADDADVSAWLTMRGFDADRVAGLDLVRALPRDGALPPWARYRGRSWRETGHRLVIPMRDAAGLLRSVRAGRVVDGESPKRLPPSGHKASALVMVDLFGLTMLRGERAPERVVITEGEPDFLARASVTNDPKTAIVGIVSGSWCEAIAQRFPVGARVVIRTDHDRAGDAYAATIAASLRRRCFVSRSVPRVAA